MVLDRLAARLGADFSQEKYGGLIARTVRAGETLLLVKPLTFMNNSGECVARVLRYTETARDDVLVIADDVNLPLGRLRFRQDGSAGGHNGLKSIIERIGGQDFARLRIGVGLGNGGGDLVNHVLGAFGSDERSLREEAVERAADATLVYVDEGVTRAMNAYNRGAPEVA
jgi:peptidyl-tRNA hydrolase, PTH1 family